MNSFTPSTNKLHANALITATFIGLIASDIIPTPGDALYFWDGAECKC